MMAEIIAQRTFTVSRAPKDGKPGDKGEDALTLVITPNTFVFQTNDKGNIENLAQNKGKIRMFLGQTEVVPSSIDVTPYNATQELLATTRYTLTVLVLTSGAEGGGYCHLQRTNTHCHC